MSVRAKLRKAIRLHPDVLNKTETAQVEKMLSRLDTLLKPAKKPAKKKAAKKTAKKTSTKKAPVKKAA